MNATARTARQPEPNALAHVQIQPLTTPPAKARARRLLARHHYLGEVRAVGEQLWYALTDAHGHWLGVLVFCAASRRLRARDQWIGWSDEQRRRRLPLVVNNCRFLLLPDKTFPNLGSRSLRLALERLSADWQARYGHPVVLVETFVDPEQFCGTVYTAQGWQELGLTEGFGRVRRDFYVEHHRPKRLLVRELSRHARRSLAAEQLKPTLAAVEAKTRPRSRHTPAQIRSLIEQLQTLPDYRSRIGIYPLWSLMAICLLAHRCGAPRGHPGASGIPLCGAGRLIAPTTPAHPRVSAPRPARQAGPRRGGSDDQPAARGTDRRPMAGGQSGRVGHRKRPAPALGRFAPGGRLPGASAQGDPPDGNVPAL